MRNYRCYSTDRGKIFSCEAIAAASDDEAVQMAEELCDQRAFGGFEVWDRGRLVYRNDEPPMGVSAFWSSSSA
jgi:hypothetical protein